jgi:predicted DNA-binding transcriptional regulator AlpA
LSPQNNKQLRPILRFADLKARRIVTNWSTLKRLTDHHGFPRGFMIGTCQRCWFESDIASWIESRPEYREPTRLLGGARMRANGEPVKPRKAKRGRT